MSKPSFNVAWDRIVINAGLLFETKTGLDFTYTVDGNTVTSSRSNQMLSKSDFEKAYNIIPLDGSGEITREVRGPAYIWAILHDQRIRQGQW
jgi:hypothetical protein